MADWQEEGGQAQGQKLGASRVNRKGHSGRTMPEEKGMEKEPQRKFRDRDEEEGQGERKGGRGTEGGRRGGGHCGGGLGNGLLLPGHPRKGVGAPQAGSQANPAGPTFEARMLWRHGA